MTTEGRKGLITSGRAVNAKLDLQMNELSPLVIGPAITERVRAETSNQVGWLVDPRRGAVHQRASHVCSNLFVCLQYIVSLLRPPLTVSQLSSALRYYIFIIRATRIGVIHQQVMTMITIG